MNIDKVKFGIETTIAGFFWSCPVFFIVLGLTGARGFGAGSLIRCAATFGRGGSIPREYLPYLFLAIIGIAYVVGIVADILTGRILFKIFPSLKNRIGAKQLVLFLQVASPELVSEYNSRRGRNTLLRTVGLALMPNALAVLFWLIRSRARVAAFIIIPLILLAGVITLFAFKRNYLNYLAFRKTASAIISEIGEQSGVGIDSGHAT